jgi:hypothetical protein
VRLSRGIWTSLAGLGAGFAAAMAATLWLRAANAESALLWNAASPGDVAVWLLALAHGVPLAIRTTGGLQAPGGGGLGDLVGGDVEATLGFDVFLLPLGLLLIVGATTGMLVRAGGPATPRRFAATVVAGGLVHGSALAVAAWVSNVHLAFSGRLAPELGLGAATGSIALEAGPSPFQAFGIGAVWGAAFIVAGGLAVPGMRRMLSDDGRMLLRGWMWGTGAGAALPVAGLVVVVLGALVTGRGPALGRGGLAALLFAPNAVSAVIVAAHGVPMRAALDAGPIAGWASAGLFDFGVGGGPAPVYAWAVLVCPVAAGVVAGRFVRRRRAMPVVRIAAGFAVLWGLTLAVLALLVRVRVLSSFSVGDAQLGGGGAAFDPLLALGAGGGWGFLMSYVGARTTSGPELEDAQEAWGCDACGYHNDPHDRFCVSCGRGMPR